MPQGPNSGQPSLRLPFRSPSERPRGLLPVTQPFTAVWVVRRGGTRAVPARRAAVAARAPCPGRFCRGGPSGCPGRSCRGELASRRRCRQGGGGESASAAAHERPAPAASAGAAAPAGANSPAGPRRGARATVRECRPLTSDGECRPLTPERRRVPAADERRS